MTLELPNGAASLIMEEEGYSKKPYKCTADKITVGYGFNVEAGISKPVAEALLRAQLEELWGYLLVKKPWIAELPGPVQAVVASMAFQMGLSGVLKFKKFFAALEIRDYAKAAHEMLDSRWAQQTTNRAERAADTVRRQGEVACL